MAAGPRDHHPPRSGESGRVVRVAARVREGGHNIPEPTIRRRYEGGLRQFFTRYRPAVDSWVFLDNSTGKPQKIAEGNQAHEEVVDVVIWQQLTAQYQ